MWNPFKKKESLRETFGMRLIPELDGAMTIASASDIFQHIDQAFSLSSVNTASRATPITKVHGFSLHVPMTFRDIFESLATRHKASGNLDALCLTQHQIVASAERHDEYLSEHESSMLFLFKAYEIYCVALISRGLDETLTVGFFLLDFPVPWEPVHSVLAIVPFKES